MNIKLVGSMAVLTAVAAVLGACGDDTTETTGAGGGTTSTTTSATTGSAGGGTGAAGGGAACELPGVATPTDCPTACSALYDCGALTCDGAALCKFTGEAAEKTGFVGDAMSGCIQTCTGMMVLIGVIDPTDCASTIDTIKSASAEFKTACTDGIMAGGGGAGGN